MAVRNPLVQVGGRLKELPSGDTLGYLPLDGSGVMAGDLQFRCGTPEIRLLSPGAVYGYDILSNVSDTVDGGLLLRKWNGTTFDNVVQMTGDGLLITPPGGASYPIRISGVLTGSGRTVQWDNNDTSAGTAMSLQMLAGAAGNGQVTQFGTEYTAVAALAGRMLLQNIGGNGVVISAAAAGTDIQFWGASNAVIGKINAAGDLTMYGAAYWGDDKEIARFSDTWLRLNPGNDFTSGIYLGTGLVRNDGPLQVGTSSTAGFYTSTTVAPQWQGIELGYRLVPFTTQNAAYTFAIGDNGKGIEHADTTARTYTVPASVFSKGMVITVLNNTTAGNVTIAAGAGVTLRLAGSSTTGNRTIAPLGWATIMFSSSAQAYVSGPGVT